VFLTSLQIFFGFSQMGLERHLLRTKGDVPKGGAARNRPASSTWSIPAMLVVGQGPVGAGEEQDAQQKDECSRGG